LTLACRWSNLSGARQIGGTGDLPVEALFDLSRVPCRSFLG
jgi:hypothetical protein